MRLFRVRFTIRRIMAALAIVALLLSQVRSFFLRCYRKPIAGVRTPPTIVPSRSDDPAPGTSGRHIDINSWSAGGLRRPGSFPHETRGIS